MKFNYFFILANEDIHLIPSGMSNHTIAQSWFRLLQTIGNPADLSRPTTISRTPKFLQAALSDPNHRLVDPSNHPCLNVLPYNFYVAIRGIASLVDAFLGKDLLYILNFLNIFLFLVIRKKHF